MVIGGTHALMCGHSGTAAILLILYLFFYDDGMLGYCEMPYSVTDCSKKSKRQAVAVKA